MKALVATNEPSGSQRSLLAGGGGGGVVRKNRTTSPFPGYSSYPRRRIKQRVKTTFKLLFACYKHKRSDDFCVVTASFVFMSYPLELNHVVVCAETQCSCRNLPVCCCCIFQEIGFSIQCTIKGLEYQFSITIYL